jgi:hypothetical protein
MVYRVFKRKQFDPDALRDMARVFDDVCRELGLAETDDAIRDIVAETVINCVQGGERDVQRIKECCLGALKN